MEIELGTDPRGEPERLRPLVDRLSRDLDSLSYYQLLGITPRASDGAVQQAFYRRAALLHPDRFHELPDAELKRQINAVYRRISEAYRVLCDLDQRAGYDRLLARGALRLTDPSQLEQAPGNGEETLDDAVRAYYDKGLALAAERRFDEAVLHLQQAANLAPKSEAVATKLRQVRVLARVLG